MKSFAHYALIALALSLAGCATGIGERVLLAGTTGAVRFDPADVARAIEIAVKKKDTDGEACYRAISKHLDQEFVLEPIGVVSLFAAGRVRIIEAGAGLAREVKRECAVIDFDVTPLLRGAVRAIGGALLP